MSFLSKLFSFQRPSFIPALGPSNSTSSDIESYPLTNTDSIENSPPPNNYNNSINIPKKEPLFDKKSKKIKVLTIILFLIMISAIIALIAVVAPSSFSIFSKASDYTPPQFDLANVSNTNYYQQGVISPIDEKGHSLEYNSQTRKSSKKLYELMSDFDTAYYDDENMILGTTLFSDNVYSRQPYVANGYIGSRIPNIGFGYALDTLNLFTDAPGALNNGWPLRNRRYAGAFVSDFYCLEPKLNSTNFPELDENGYNTVISSIPQWTNLQFSLDNGTVWFNPLEVENIDVINYSQNLSMKDGIVTTDLDWIDNMLHVKSDIWAHRKIYPLGMVSLEISLNVDNLPEEFESVDLDVWDVLDFNTSHRTVLKDLGADDDGIFMVVQPKNVPYSNAAIYSTCTMELENKGSVNFTTADINDDDGTVSKVGHVLLTRENSKVTIHKYTGVMSTEFNDNERSKISTLEAAKLVSMNSKGNYDVLLSSHKQAWYTLYNLSLIHI